LLCPYPICSCKAQALPFQSYRSAATFFSEQAPQHSITLLYTKLFKDKILCYPKNFPTIPLVECWADGRQALATFAKLRFGATIPPHPSLSPMGRGNVE